ncbi:MAG: GxxExxY protein [Acidobacteriota bacterium]|nr:GxxExxY protein [Acidobacteriota bacterium]MDH3530034.1 GxxExxY protein [Acidobacteriota bacterium]
MLTKKYLDELSYEAIGAAIEVHKAVGPGLCESVYHRCMEHELSLRNLRFRSELFVPVEYKGVKLDAELKCDLFLEECLAVELKSVKTLMPVNEAQLLTYMSLLNIGKGLLVNFNCTNIFKSGQKTLVNKMYRNLPDQ